jgi:trehalose 6-phosphate phosphatase
MLPEPQSDWALFLDVDGTLVEIAETPDGVKPDQRLPGVLAEISRILDGAVALISGRPIETLDMFFAPLRLPSAGLHGLEYRDAGGVVHQPPISPSVRAATEAAKAFAGDHPDVLIEDKGTTVALHYRQNPALEPEIAAFAEAQIAHFADLRLQMGKMVAEIRPNGNDKGTAIRRFMEMAPFQGRTPVFIGDDVTDEAGFAVVNALGGHSIRVGAAITTAARHRIPDVSSLHRWLLAWAEPVDG